MDVLRSSFLKNRIFYLFLGAVGLAGTRIFVIFVCFDREKTIGTIGLLKC